MKSTLSAVSPPTYTRCAGAGEGARDLDGAQAPHRGERRRPRLVAADLDADRGQVARSRE